MSTALEQGLSESPAGTRGFVPGVVAKVLSGAVLQGVSALVYGLATVLVARAVEPAVFGELMVGVTIALVGGDALDLGRSTALIRLQAQGGTATRHLAHRLIISKVLWSPLLLATLVGADLLISGRVHLSMLVFWFYAVLYTTWQTLVTPARGAANLTAASSCATQERVVTLAVTAATLPFLGSAALPVGLTLGAATVCLRLARPGWVEGETMTMREFTRSARPLAVVSLTSDAQQLDVPLVAAVAGATSGGVFAAASRLIGPLSLVTTQVSLLVLARAARVVNPLTRRQALMIVGALAAVYVPGLAFVSWQSDLIVRLLLGDKFAAGAGLLWILSVGVGLSVVAAPLIAWMQARGTSRVAAAAYSVSLAVYFVVLLVGAAHDDLRLVAVAYPLMQAVTLLVVGGALVRRRLRRATGARHRA